MRDLMGLDVELFPHAPFASRTWALRSNLASDGAWYVVVAESLNTTLINCIGS